GRGGPRRVVVARFALLGDDRGLAIAGLEPVASLRAGCPSPLDEVMPMSAAEQFHISEVSSSYWRVTFDNGPVNLLDPNTIEQLAALIGRIEQSPELNVVVFRSDKPGYLMAHWDFLADNARVVGMHPGPTGLHPYLDN